MFAFPSLRRALLQAEYDNYIAALLDSQNSRHQQLYSQVEQLSASGTSNPRTFKKGQDRLHGLENQAKEALRENARLRKQVEKEIEMAHSYKAPPAVSKKTRGQDQPELSLSEQVEEMRATILERMDQVKSIQGQLRENYVPTSVCNHLAQCCKETEVEIQKLMKQNEYWEHSINELSHDLEEAIDLADTTERDTRRIWKRVNATGGIHASLTVKSGPTFYSSTYVATGRVASPKKEEYSDDDEKETYDKWSWYIS